MNRPVLPYAISSVPAEELASVTFDRAEFSDIIQRLVESYDRADGWSLQSASAASVPAFRV